MGKKFLSWRVHRTVTEWHTSWAGLYSTFVSPWDARLLRTMDENRPFRQSPLTITPSP